LLNDISVLTDRNVGKKEAENILKYKDLQIEIWHTWNVKLKVIPVIIFATLTLSQYFKTI
jgi:hypothetical protein